MYIVSNENDKLYIILIYRSKNIILITNIIA